MSGWLNCTILGVSERIYRKYLVILHYWMFRLPFNKMLNVDAPYILSKKPCLRKPQVSICSRDIHVHTHVCVSMWVWVSVSVCVCIPLSISIFLVEIYRNFVIVYITLLSRKTHMCFKMKKKKNVTRRLVLKENVSYDKE